MKDIHHPLVIFTKRIKDEGVYISDSFSPASIQLEYEFFLFKSEVEVDLSVHRLKDQLVIRGRISTEAQGECDRCLHLVPFSIQLDEETFTVDHRDADIVDIKGEVRDLILLALPSKVICSEDCKGICPQCKVNLNDASCSCEKGDSNSFSGIEWPDLEE